MTIDEKGNVVWVKESDDHRLYYMNNDGLLSDDSECIESFNDCIERIERRRIE